MQQTDADHHDHANGFEIPKTEPGPAGPVNEQLLSAFIGGAVDGCPTCQDSTLTLLVQDPNTIARLVELACLFVQHAIGGMPTSLTDPQIPGAASDAFKHLARHAVESQEDMYNECQAASADDLRAAANTAADLIVGCLHTL